MSNVNTVSKPSDAELIAKHMASKGATVVPSATATGGASKQARTKAPAQPAPKPQAKEPSAKAVTLATQRANAGAAVVQAATQAAAVALPKTHTAHVHVAKPTAKSLTRIATLSATVPPRGMRPKLWANYKVGQTLLYSKMSDGLDPLQTKFYAENGYATLRPCTADELALAVAAWEKGPEALYALLHSWVGQA